MALLRSRRVRLSAVAATLAATALVGFSASADAQVVNNPNAQVVNTSTALTGAPGANVVPNGTSLFTVGVKCGWWNGQVQWGGIGIIANPGYIQVTGTIHSSCNSTTYAYIKHTQGTQVFPYSLFAKTGPYSKDTANYYTQSISGPIGNIYINVCSNRYGWTCKAHKA